MKETILDIAEEMVQDRGLNAVSFQDLADAVGIRKPSVFHHFKNKEALSLALIDRCKTKHGPLYAEVVAMEIPAPEKLHRIADIFVDGLNANRPCLLAALGSSVNTLTDTSAKELKIAADGAIDRFTEVFKQGRKEGSLKFDGKPRHAAMCFFGMVQGLQILTRANDDQSSYRHAIKTYIGSITFSFQQ